MSDRLVTQGTLQEAGGNSTRDGLEGRSPPEVPYGTQVAAQSAGGIPTEPADRARAAQGAGEAGVPDLGPGATVQPSQVREPVEEAAAGADLKPAKNQSLISSALRACSRCSLPIASSRASSSSAGCRPSAPTAFSRFVTSLMVSYFGS